MPEYLETTVDKFIFQVATDRLYTAEGVWVLWVEPDGDRSPRRPDGLPPAAQRRRGLRDVKPVGTRLAAGDEFAEIETIKANVACPRPSAGAIVEVNPALELTPEVINQDPYGDGWLAVIDAADWEADRGGCSTRRPTSW